MMLWSPLVGFGALSPELHLQHGFLVRANRLELAGFEEAPQIFFDCFLGFFSQWFLAHGFLIPI